MMLQAAVEALKLGPCRSIRKLLIVGTLGKTGHRKGYESRMNGRERPDVIFNNNDRSERLINI